jgi:hypothetical protein
LFIPDSDFLPIPDPRSRGQKDTGSLIRIRNTDRNKHTDDYVGGLAAEFGGYPLEARLLPDLGGGVHVLHGEDGAQPEQKDLRQRRNQLNSEYYIGFPLSGVVYFTTIIFFTLLTRGKIVLLLS